jgi:hypothetical protein
MRTFRTVFMVLLTALGLPLARAATGTDPAPGAGWPAELEALAAATLALLAAWQGFLHNRLHKLEKFVDPPKKDLFK